MALWQSFIRRAYQAVFRVPRPWRRVGRQLLRMVRGRPPSQTFAEDLARRGIIQPEQIPEVQQAWLEHARGGVGPVPAVPAPPESLEAALPEDMLKDVPWKRTKELPYESRTGRPYQYRVRLVGIDEFTGPDGEVRQRVTDRWVTVASDKELSKRQVLSRAHEMMNPDWAIEGTNIEGSFAGFGEVQPVRYSIFEE